MNISTALEPSAERLHRVSKSRTVVLTDGRTDVAATLYNFGSPSDREVAAKMLLSTGRAMLDDAKALNALATVSGDVVNTLRDEASAMILRALWMAPDGTRVKIHGGWYELAGLDSDGGIHYGTADGEGVPVNIREEVAENVEDLSL